MQCFQCGRAVELKTAQTVGKRDTCPQCDADLHVCRNCRHFEPTAHNECREVQAEWVRYKDRNNYCDYFSPLASGGGVRGGAGGESSARKKFDDLFK